MGFKKDFVRNVAKFGSYTYLLQIVDFSSSIVLSRLISPEEYGFVALITVFSGFIHVFSDVGIRHTIIRHDYDEEKIGKFFGLTIWVGIFLFVLFSLLSYPIALFYGNMNLVLPVLVAATAFLTQSLSIVPQSLGLKHLNFSTVGISRILQSLFMVVFMIILAFLNFSYWSLIIPLSFSPIVQFIYLNKKIKYKRKFVSLNIVWELLVEIKSLVGNITVSGIINYWLRNADNLIIGKIYGEGALGLYNRAYKFIYIANRLITHIFGSVTFPSLKKLKDEVNDDSKVRKEFLGILGGISLLNYPFGFVLILFPHLIVSVLWGQNWLGVVQFLPYVGVLILTQPLFSATTDFYVLMQKEKTVFIVALVNSVFILSGIIIGAFFSPLHILIGYTIAYQILIVLMPYIGFYKSLNYKFSDLVRFFGPKFILSSLLVYFIYISFIAGQIAIAILYLAHILYSQRYDFDKILVLIKVKRNKTILVKD